MVNITQTVYNLTYQKVKDGVYSLTSCWLIIHCPLNNNFGKYSLYCKTFYNQYVKTIHILQIWVCTNHELARFSQLSLCAGQICTLGSRPCILVVHLLSQPASYQHFSLWCIAARRVLEVHTTIWHNKMRECISICQWIDFNFVFYNYLFTRTRCLLKNLFHKT